MIKRNTVSWLGDPLYYLNILSALFANHRGSEQKGFNAVVCEDLLRKKLVWQTRNCDE